MDNIPQYWYVKFYKLGIENMIWNEVQEILFTMKDCEEREKKKNIKKKTQREIYAEMNVHKSCTGT